MMIGGYMKLGTTAEILKSLTEWKNPNRATFTSGCDRMVMYRYLRELEAMKFVEKRKANNPIVIGEYRRTELGDRFLDIIGGNKNGKDEG